jgi:PHD/YefM family antitoxin component YafN of YafNO toxin-antitoxin module
MNENMILEFMTKIYSEMQKGFENTDKNLESVKHKLIILENNQKEKFGVLFDADRLNKEILERLETRQEEHIEKIEHIENLVRMHDMIIRKAK